MPDFKLFPLPFWLTLLAIAFFAIRSWQQSESSLRIPMLMVLFTITIWYVVDALYNDYTLYILETSKVSLENAWWETLGFICAFGLLSPLVHRSFNRKYLGRPSILLSLVRHGGLKSNKIQDQVDILFRFLLILWIGLMTVALIRTDFNFSNLFTPYLSDVAYPWARARVGTNFDSLLSVAAYLQIGLTAALGVVAALACRRTTLFPALIVLFLALPDFIFDRTRGNLLATTLPGFLTFVFVRVRAGTLVRAVILILGFLALDSWLKFVIENRSANSITTAFRLGLAGKTAPIESGKHSGLNMFEELGYINYFLANKSYHPNWGARYFAEIVNPIPRSLWPGKPYVGIDYAIVRGQGYGSSDNAQAGVGASVSTGMIGQGVVNFGRILGPLSAALIMAFWAAILARQDIRGGETGRLLLYAIGLILTFNMGRDITLFVTYPFLFGYLLLLIFANKSKQNTAPAVRPPRRRIAPSGSPPPKTAKIA